MKNIRLTTPLQRAEENPAVELDPGTLERWLAELPVKDVLATVGRLDEAISAFNEVKVAAAERLKLLEVYFGACHSILQSYDEMRIAQLNISPKQKQQVANNILWLYIKLSHGYKIIVKDYADQPENAKPPSYLLLTTFRALELTVSSLICSYRFGLDTPPLAYIELHQLYAFAEHFGIADKTVKKVSGYAKSPTIASYYTLALIFISLEPRQYDSYTLEVLFLALQPFAFDCPITHACNPDDGSYSFKINLIDNQPPQLLGIAEANTKESIRFLDIGLEYLTGSPYPLTYMMMSDEDERINATPSNGIYLLDETNGENAPLIIVNRTHYKESQQYLITTRDNVCMVVATKLISQTLRYAFFQFRILTGTL